MEEQKKKRITRRNDLFPEVAGEWLDSLRPQLKESTIVKYTNILNRYLLPEYQERPISEISRKEVAAVGNRLLSAGRTQNRGLSPKTVAGILSVLKSIFDYAAQENGCLVEDIRGISVKQPQKVMRVLSRAEQQRLSDYLRREPIPCHLGILVSLYMGLRIGEVCALKWEDILFEERYLSVHRTMQRVQTLEEGRRKTEVRIFRPKSDCSNRKIPIPDELFRLLETKRQEEGAYLLTGQTERYMEPRTMQNRFKMVLARCGISDAHFHTLRHTFATRCVELGFDVKSLSEILGHATVNITMNRYVHPSMELKQQNMDRLSGLFEGEG